jgi:hypothetical protein
LLLSLTVFHSAPAAFATSVTGIPTKFQCDVCSLKKLWVKLARHWACNASTIFAHPQEICRLRTLWSIRVLKFKFESLKCENSSTKAHLLLLDTLLNNSILSTCHYCRRSLVGSWNKEIVENRRLLSLFCNS